MALKGFSRWKETFLSSFGKSFVERGGTSELATSRWRLFNVTLSIKEDKALHWSSLNLTDKRFVQ